MLSKNNYEAVIFDLDGTLMHTKSSYRYQLVREVFFQLVNSEYDLKEDREDPPQQPTKQEINEFWYGLHRNQIIKNLFHLDPDQYWQVFHQQDEPQQREENIEPYPDLDFLETLLDRGYKLGIVTGAPARILEVELSKIGHEKFGSTVTAKPEDNIKPKPDPEGINICLRELGVAADKAVYVGNGPEDIKSAKNAGVVDILIKRGDYWVEGIEPSFVITSLYQLEEILKQDQS